MTSQMKRSSYIVLRPICFFIFLMLMVLSLAGALTALWIIRATKIENEVKFISHNNNHELFLRIQKTGALFSSIDASSINLVRILRCSFDENDLQFSMIISKVAFSLFQALSIIPYVSQISYTGLDGLFFAYYKVKGDQLYALYSNSTFSAKLNNTDNYTWYMQPVNRDTGKLYGEAIKSVPSAIVNSSWFLGALNSTSGYASVGSGYGNSQDIMLLSSVALGGKGVISLGFSMKPLINFLIAEIAFYNGSLYLATTDGYVLTNGISDACMILEANQVSFHNISCQFHDSKFRDDTLSIWRRKYVISYSPVEIAGLQFLCALALPQNENLRLIHKNIRLSFVLLILVIGAMVITTCTFVFLIVEAARREMYLCGALINQMEATQQSERKSMNKSLAFSSASHDIRASLAGITGLIEICRNEVTKRDPLRSQLQVNLLQMEACSGDLLGILNSILDTGKIEAGKMQLDEEEFDIQQLLEDVVDLFHTVGMKKGIDVILDPYDGSVSKYYSVKGDRSKLKQILSNLLSNAVKFTSEGNVTVRAWARKPTLGNEVLASSQNNSIRCCTLFEIGRANSELEVVSTILQRDPNCMEFVFEVNDTGKGIPKEKQKSVFENYVQVKETGFGQEGTGLGLGIVQSLVRLVGGEIGIVDKEVGERGTCFQFNVFFGRCESETSRNSRVADIESKGYYISSDCFQYSGPTICIYSPKTEGSQVILFIQSAKRSTVLQTFMQRLGVKVHVVCQYQHLSPTLKRIKKKLSLSQYSSSGKSERNSRKSDGHGSPASSTRSKDVPLSTLDGIDNHISNSQKWPKARLGFILIVIDTCAGPFREITRAVAEFRRDLNENCYSRVIWLDKPDVNSKRFEGLDEVKLPPSDFVISKPFHGSRLYQAIRLLPEFGGEISHNVEKVEPRIAMCEIEEVRDKANKKNKPLAGKKILVADDNPIGRKIATFVASQLGANIFSCENGEEALKLVTQSLNNGDAFPFDYILMDSEMGVMDGREATQKIREAEKNYGVHTHIIVVTAHNNGDEIQKMIQAGVDAYIIKPLNKHNFLNALYAH